MSTMVLLLLLICDVRVCLLLLTINRAVRNLSGRPCREDHRLGRGSGTSHFKRCWRQGDSGGDSVLACGELVGK
jgi:hypothetical protein